MRATLSVAFLFSLGKNRCETDLCSTKIGGDNHTKTIQESKTGVGSVLRSQYRTAQLQRTLPPMHPLLQAKFSRHCGGLSPQGAKKCTKPPQFPKIGCGDESIRRRNKRAAHEKKTAKHAPFSYRKRHLTVSPRKRRKSAAIHLSSSKT